MVALLRLFTFVAIAFIAAPSSAATRVHALVIGNNEVFRDAAGAGDATLAPLKYADDDAAAVAAFLQQIAASVHLLTSMDAATQRLYSSLVERARPPTPAAVEAAVDALAAELARDRGRGDESVVWVFFSGHGSLSAPGGPALALLGGGIDREFLYEAVLARLPARYVHLIIDACHAEAIVRPREADAEAVTVTPAAADALLGRATLARFPNAGAILGSTSGAQAHEWEAIGHGVFTHELLSALRGAADVNGDRRIEYSEVRAFMSAANRGIADSRARPAIVARPPEANGRALLIDLAQFPRDRNGWLTDVSGKHGTVRIADALGRQLVTVHNAGDLSNAVLLPSSGTIFVTAGALEAELSLRPGHNLSFGEVAFKAAGSRGRGEIAAALRRGLFATPFGRGYYEGFTADEPQFLPVEFARAQSAGERARSKPPSTPERSGWRVGVGAALSSSVAVGLGPSKGVQVGIATLGRRGPSAALDLVEAGDDTLQEWRSSVRAGYLFQTAPARVRGYAGGRAGGGVIIQHAGDEGTLAAPVALAAPVIGGSLELGSGFGLYSEVEVAGMLLRIDSRTTFSVMPLAVLGATWEP